jgi:hypothetical protein
MKCHTNDNYTLRTQLPDKISYIVAILIHNHFESPNHPIYSVETLTGIKFIAWTWAIFAKNPETGRFLFFLAYILMHMVFAYLLPEVRNNPLLFFSNIGVYQVRPRLKAPFARNTTHYIFVS